MLCLDVLRFLTILCDASGLCLLMLSTISATKAPRVQFMVVPSRQA